MAYTPEKIEKNIGLKNKSTARENKLLKKSMHKKNRQKAKQNIEAYTPYNRHMGWQF